MPSEKILESKKELVNGLAEKLKNAVAGVLVDYKGIDVATDTKMRKELREAGVDYFVVKNTMLRFATKEVGYDFDEVLNLSLIHISRRGRRPPAEGRLVRLYKAEGNAPPAKGQIY